ncbi:MAG: FG-GAP repeat protein, partial [Thermoflexales bacterium]|nr:FG-GAP repeat protein [Thermoflexales bacterium]
AGAKRDLPPDLGQLEGAASPAPGFPVQFDSGSYAYDAATTLADLEGDGNVEIIVGGRALNADGSLACQGKVYVYRNNGSLAWQATVRAGVNSSAAAADLNGDGVKDVVVGMGAWHDDSVKYEDRTNECGTSTPNVPTAPGNGGVIALNGTNGSALWTFDTQDWGEWGAGPNGEMANGVRDGVFSSPAVGDVNGDGQPEVVFGSWDNCIYLLDKNGNPLWGRVPFDYYNPSTGQDFCGGHGFFNHDTVWSSPALADLTGDGKLEIVVGGDISCDDPTDPSKCNRYQVPSGGLLWVIRHDGVPLARKWFDQAIFSSPAVADLDNDDNPEIVVGTGQAFQYKGYYVTATNLDLGQADVAQALPTKWQATVVGRTFSSPAIGDLDGNGILDVVTIIKYGEFGLPVGPEDWNGSYVYALRGNDGSELWRTHATIDDGRSFPINASPVLADITGDDRPEVFFPHAWAVDVLNSGGTYYARYGGNGSFAASVAVGDLDGNNALELVAPGRWNENDHANRLRGALYVWTGYTAGPTPWPMFHKNAQHTGSSDPPPKLRVSPTRFNFLLEPTDDPDHTASVYLSNQGGGGPIAWTASSNKTWLTVDPGSGQTNSTLTLNIQAPQTVTGTLRTGWSIAQVSIQATNAGVENPDQVVTVYLHVGTVYRVFLPAVLKNR